MDNRPPKAPNFVLIIGLMILVVFLYGVIPRSEHKPAEFVEEKIAPVVSSLKQPKTNILVVLKAPIKISISAKEIVITEDIYATSISYSDNSTMITIVPVRTDLGEKLVIPLSEVQYIRYGN